MKVIIEHKQHPMVAIICTFRAASFLRWHSSNSSSNSLLDIPFSLSSRS